MNQASTQDEQRGGHLLGFVIVGLCSAFVSGVVSSVATILILASMRLS